MTTIVYHTELRNPKREAMLTSNGKPAKDQYVLTYEDGSTAFESYGTLIAHRPVNYPKQRIRLDRDAWNYSITTARYRNRFLGKRLRKPASASRTASMSWPHSTSDNTKGYMMFTDMISNIFGRKTKSTQPTARKRSRRIPDGDVHGCQTVRRTIKVNGEVFTVGIGKKLNAMSRRIRLRQMVTHEEQVFFDKSATMHNEVARLVKTRVCKGRQFVVNPATIRGKRIPEQSVTVVTRVK